ncbi:WD40 repeat-like protein [Coprinellus micaceus]|uniref:WD40 repeat-like protein n=1 Tax=Coprinellus micaceus TaxID=71717 RepID=A0A4Y7TAS5_COPMI|nr:WD40 repeat-like protein [Coprinellus micaceus]
MTAFISFLQPGDLRLKIWDFHQEDIKGPACEFVGPVGNIFTISFSANNRYIYAGGVCEKVFRYDTSMLGSSAINTSPEAVYTEPSESVRELSCHPTNEDLLLCASQDGVIRRYDARSSRPNGELQMQSEASGVEYHPQMHHLFVTSDNRGNVCLRDERMAFSSERSDSDGVVLTFNTKLTRADVTHISKPEVSSIAFDREGEASAIRMSQPSYTQKPQNYLPTIYTLSDPNPVAVCSGKFLPDGSAIPVGQRTYANSCTMKHGHFGGPSMDYDAFYGAGSDDFRGYIWQIPPVAQLLEEREEISPVDWLSNASETPGLVAFTEGYARPKFVPKDLSTPFCLLNGHRSIVNTVLFHPRLLHIVTAGIERDIILHSPTPGSPCTQDLDGTPREVRDISDNDVEDRLVYFRSLVGELSDDDRGEERMISMFDHILRVGGQGDVFQTRRWIPASDSSEEEILEDDTTDSSDDDTDWMAIGT